ncbi:MAG: hypoxanthine phosphoribosyltransferase [Eubacteriales bacterium]|nr:hypoxanthine phosphoribosyltransferase [Eubacteriales bacterium]
MGFFKKDKSAEAENSNIVNVNGTNIEVLITEERLKARIKTLAEEISNEHAGQSVHLVCVLKGGVFFLTELAKHMTIPVTIGFFAVRGYGAGSGSRNVVKITKDLDDNIEGRHVVLVDDIIGTGYTHSFLIDVLKTKNPASIELCTLLSNAERRIKDVDVDYCGFGIPNTYVVGFGLDSHEQFRDLPFIGIIKK